AHPPVAARRRLHQVVCAPRRSSALSTVDCRLPSKLSGNGVRRANTFHIFRLMEVSVLERSSSCACGWYSLAMKIDLPSHLSDDDLVSQLKSLARCEREATARLVAHLAEL